jgi:hypothetical protein
MRDLRETNMLGRVFAAGLICAAGAVAAQSPPQQQAQRYIDSQGIEIVQNRNTRAAADKIDSLASTADKQRSLVSKPSASIAPEPAGTSSRSVSAKEQGVRDQDRLAILRKELSTELVQLESATTALQNRRLTEKTESPEQLRLQYAVGLAQQNIRALTAELNRTPVVR